MRCARIWRSGQSVDLNRGTLRAWFYVIARNCALRILETKRGPRALRFVDNLDALIAKPLEGGKCEPDPRREEFVRALHACIAKLPSQQRAVILADLAAGGMAETAHLVSQLETTANSIYVARASGRKALRVALTALGYPDAARDGAQEGGGN